MVSKVNNEFLIRYLKLYVFYEVDFKGELLVENFLIKDLE